MLTQCDINTIREAIKKNIYSNKSGGNIKISLGQLLLLSIDACTKENLSPEILNQLKKLYLKGITSNSEQALIDELTGLVKEYQKIQISQDHDTTNNDHSRRYFETHLAYAMLTEYPKNIDINQLTNLTENLKSNLYRQKINPSKVELILNGTPHKSLNKYELEYTHLILELKNTQFHNLPEEACQRLLEIAKCTILATLNTMYDKTLPADIYTDSIFTMGVDGRGRKNKTTQKQVKTLYKGLMTSISPLPRDDIAYDKVASPFLRSVDQATFIKGSSWVDHLFSRKTQIFSNGISSTTLAMLRNLLYQKRLENTAFTDHFGGLIKSFAALMVFNSGGHSFFEIFEVLKISQFKSLYPDTHWNDDIASDSLMTNLLFSSQMDIFNSVLAKTIPYSKHLINKSIVRQELLENQTNMIEINFLPKPIHQWIQELSARELFLAIKSQVLEGKKSISELESKAKIEGARRFLNYKNNHGYTPLMFAAQMGQLEHVKMLVEMGANVTRNLKQYYPNCKDPRPSGLTCLELAIKAERYDVAEYLLRQTKLKIKKYNKKSIDLKDEVPALYYACRQKNPKIIRLVVNNEPELNISDKFSALQEAIQFENEGALTMLLELFKNEIHQFSNKQKQILLEKAVQTGNITSVRKLILIKNESINYEKLLNIAHNKYYPAIIKILLNQQFSKSLNKSTLAQNTLNRLMYSSMARKKYDITMLAIVYGANPNQLSIFKHDLNHFADYLSDKPSNYFRELFVNEDQSVINYANDRLKVIQHNQTHSLLSRIVDLMLEFVGAIFTPKIQFSNIAKKEILTRLAYQAITTHKPLADDQICQKHKSGELSFFSENNSQNTSEENQGTYSESRTPTAYSYLINNF